MSDALVEQFGGGPYRRCQSCSTQMPPRSVRAFKDDGTWLFVCRDGVACEARRSGRTKLSLIDQMADAYLKATGIHWTDLHINHHLGLQAVLDVARRGQASDREDGYNLRLLHMTKRIQDLEAWRRRVESMRPEPPEPHIPFAPGVS